jgi:molybdopterin synthase sulfur carrier subunit
MPVRITLLYFAAVRDIVGRGDETLELPPGVSTLRDLATHLEAAIPALAGRLRYVRWARNEELVQIDAAIAEGDVIALIPPVAGG